ncbi:MAG TPA: hypothetical protein PKA00_05630 [Saprospiraceae bacterium]|nr:hypothetical protein [Saprospiraceae bacterium]HMQ82362.1 hypothetical protein [Saprospiraceae bacterium]
MMRYFFLALIFLATGFKTLQAQQFSFSPDTVLTAQAQLEQYNIFNIYIQNETSDSLQLTWRIVENTLPEAWETTLCDNNECYGILPAYGNMIPFSANEPAFIKLDINPHQHQAEGLIRFRIFPTDDPSDYEVITFYISSLLSGTDEPIVVFPTFGPNPVKDALWLSGTDEKQTLQLWNGQGQLLRTLSLEANLPYRLDLSDLPKGAYWLSNSFQQHILIKQ